MKEIENQKEKHFARKEKIFGQFMTPPRVADFIVDFAILSLNHGVEFAIDPACGDGVFLEALIKKKNNRIVGVDIDEKIIPDNLKAECEIFAPQDGLLSLDKKFEERADIVVGNPPFSAKYGRVRDTEILSRFELGEKQKSQAIEILFLERFLQLASESGIIGIILPSGIFSNIPLQYVREFIHKNSSVISVISLPRGIFGGIKSTTSKTNILFAKKHVENKENVFMGIANKLKDLSLILKSYQQKRETHYPSVFFTKINFDVLSPEYYFKPVHFKSNQKIMRLNELISEMFCGKTEYGPKRRFTAGGIRFISAKTVTPLGIDFSKEDRNRHYIDPEGDMNKPKAHVKVGDLLFVRVGVGCIGRSGVVTSPSECGIADDWIYIIRTKDPQMAYYLAFYVQSKYGKLQLDKMKRGVGTVTVPQTLLKNLLIPVPPKSFQREFKKFYLAMVEERKKDREKAEKIHEKAMKKIEGII